VIVRYWPSLTRLRSAGVDGILARVADGPGGGHCRITNRVKQLPVVADCHPLGGDCDFLLRVVASGTCAPNVARKILGCAPPTCWKALKTAAPPRAAQLHLLTSVSKSRSFKITASRSKEVVSAEGIEPSTY